MEKLCLKDKAMVMNEYIIVFKNTHDAIEAEKSINAKGIKIIVMPTPTHITQSCGISIRFKEEELSKVEELAREEKVKYKNIYIKNNMQFKLYK
ncbi:DUF3343 domain-containing protein [Clostridium polyendosporum]|nr:DUF3343 domain-containing protein [Clostridium polyendosporum]